ncbi:MAG: hypothetical protein K8H88_01585 [Sandaracinaceae bacterium]|nr:hypothetical protein [Sandaracinaceae bacterium]
MPSARARIRRWLRRLALVLASAALAELGAAIVYRADTGLWPGWDAMQEARAERWRVSDPLRRTREPASPRPAWLAEEVVHPYLGYVTDPSAWGPEGDTPPLAFTRPLFEPRSDRRLVVLVVGGSVAGAVGPALGRALGQTHARASDPRELVYVNIAFGGFKQPQQLQALSYLYSLGAHVDVVINIDGFNEVVLSWLDNASRGVHPVYPRQWDMRFTAASDVATVREIGAVAVWRDVRAQLAARISDGPWRYSSLANVSWFYVDRWMGAELASHEGALRQSRGARSYQRFGPNERFDLERTLGRSVEVWAASSVTMGRLVHASGGRYVHILQPNQYLPGSKPLSVEERARFYRPEAPVGSTAAAGYPRLRARGEALARQGVSYHDLTMLFAQEERTTYVDEYCHLNDLGNELLAARVAELVMQALDRAP